MDASPLPRPPHVGLVRCALAVLLAALCLPPALVGLSHIFSGVLFAEFSTWMGAGGLADKGIVALHHTTRDAVLEWVQYHLPTEAGLFAALIFLHRRTPRWLARCVGGIP